MDVIKSSSRSFYLAMSLLMVGIVTYGFSRTIGASLLHSTKPNRVLVGSHGAIFYAWMLLFVAQCALIRVHRLRLHRLLGWLAAGDGVLVVISGVWITFTTAAPTVFFRLIGMVSILGFTVPFVLAIRWRRQPEIHRRLLFIGSAVLTNAAFARFPSFFDPAQLFYAGTDLLILAGIAHDLYVRRTVHVVYRIAFPVLLAAEITVLIPVWRYLR
ncbi:MAG: hypothetical protein JO210_00650 [Acidobacteriaceae bacterium]|nr:hypothetical protein [Acidobacteriaceae bacterium]